MSVSHLIHFQLINSLFFLQISIFIMPCSLSYCLFSMKSVQHYIIIYAYVRIQCYLATAIYLHIYVVSWPAKLYAMNFTFIVPHARACIAHA